MAAGATALAGSITSAFGTYMSDLDALLAIPITLAAVGLILTVVVHAMRG
jgi:hypothetical protein